MSVVLNPVSKLTNQVNIQSLMPPKVDVKLSLTLQEVYYPTGCQN